MGKFISNYGIKCGKRLYIRGIVNKGQNNSQLFDLKMIDITIMKTLGDDIIRKCDYGWSHEQLELPKRYVDAVFLFVGCIIFVRLESSPNV